MCHHCVIESVKERMLSRRNLLKAGLGGAAAATAAAATAVSSFAQQPAPSLKDRMGEIVQFATTDGKRIKAEICSPVFLDPEGERQNV